jgi:ribosomal protein S18 acetylase RimI-like enzyme
LEALEEKLKRILSYEHSQFAKTGKPFFRQNIYGVYAKLVETLDFYPNLKQEVIPMPVTYKDTQTFTPAELQDLFLSVEWSSGHYPDKLVIAMQNAGSVFTAWDGDHLIGLINALDDGVMTAYVHYLLVNPAYQGQGIGKQLVRMVAKRYQDYLRIVLIAYDKEVGFYQNCGFEVGGDKTPMFITSLWT